MATTFASSIVVHGGRRLSGAVPISGYKHALTVIVAAAVARSGAVALDNVPVTTESQVLEAILSRMGADSRLVGGRWDLDTGDMRAMPVPGDLSCRAHGSLYLAPALLARFGEVSFAGAGGDRIGPPELGGHRPIAQIAVVMERFGADVDPVGGGLHATARSLRGCELDIMEFSTDTHRLRGPAASSATKAALILASVAQGPTAVRHPVDIEATRELCHFLRACGVSVTDEGDTWRVHGAGRRDLVPHRLLSDSSEIVTFIAGAAHVGASLLLTGITGERSWSAIEDELRVFEAIGVPLRPGPDWLKVGAPSRLEPLSLEVECNGFSTDAQPLLALVLLGAGGESRITDHVWTSRFAYSRLLTAMGARIHIQGNTIHLRPSALRAAGAPLRPTDSRAAAVAVLAALGVNGTSRIDDAGGHLDRGYERLLEKLGAVGAQTEVETGDCGW